MRLPIVLLAALTGCQDAPAATAEEAYLRVAKACRKHDAARLFDALDTRTQWSIESVHHAQREMRRNILASYPMAEQPRALGHIPAACEESEEQPRRYYRRIDGSISALDDVCRRIAAGTGQPIGTVDGKAGTAEVWREGGSIFHFARDDQGRWGWSELRPEWEQAKLRAMHDAETVLANKMLYLQQRMAP